MRGFIGGRVDPYSKFGKYYYLLSLVAGIVLIVLGMMAAVRTANEVKTMVRTDATIISVDTEGSKPHKTTLEYDVSGERVRQTTEDYFITYRPGRRIPVAYPADDPADVRIVDFSRYLRDGILAFIGLCVSIGCVIVLLKCWILPKRRERKRRENRDKPAPWER